MLVVEVRPNLLAGESERFHLADVNQVYLSFLFLFSVIMISKN